MYQTYTDFFGYILSLQFLIPFALTAGMFLPLAASVFWTFFQEDELHRK